MRYEEDLIQPFRDELTRLGFRELRTAGEVDAVMQEKKGTNFVVVNSVCGCAAGKARPGIALALRNAAGRPDLLTTVFAGGDVEATARMREYFGNIPPSSPSMALYKDGALVHFVPRYRIESWNARMIAEHLVDVFGEYCSPPVPSGQPVVP